MTDQPLRELIANAPFRRYVLIGLLAQILFWYFSMPGPQLRSDYLPSLNGALGCCAIALITLLVLPLATALVNRQSLSEIGLGFGDWSFGVKAILVVTPIFVVATVAGSGNEQMMNFYPLPGVAVGENWGSYLLWLGGYAAFYFAFEFFYRGFLLRAPEPMGLTYGFVLSLCCCVLVHVGKPFVETLAAIPASILFGWIAVRSRSIYYAFAIHLTVGIANDLSILWQHESLQFWN